MGGAAAALAEETEIVLRWLEAPGVRMVELDGSWTCPVGGAGAVRHELEPAVTESITTGCVGCSVAGSPSCPIRSTTSRPLVTFPTRAYSGGSPASAPVTTKNWLPAVPAGSLAVFAIATAPLV